MKDKTTGEQGIWITVEQAEKYQAQAQQMEELKKLNGAFPNGIGDYEWKVIENYNSKNYLITEAKQEIEELKEKEAKTFGEWNKMHNKAISIRKEEQALRAEMEGYKALKKMMEDDGKKWHEAHKEIIDAMRRYQQGEPTEQKAAYDFIISVWDKQVAQAQQIEELKEGLKEIEMLCDNQNETHEAIWRIANELLKTKDDERTKD